MSNPSHTHDDHQIIYRFQRQEGEEVQFSLRNYQGRQYGDLRIWYEKNPGEWRPTRKGVILNLGQLQKLKDGVLALFQASAQYQTKLEQSPGPRSSKPPYPSYK